MPSPSEASSSRQSSPVSVEEENEWKMKSIGEESSSDNDGESNHHELDLPTHSSPSAEQSSSADEREDQADDDDDDSDDQREEESEELPATFESLGLIKPLLTAIEHLKYKKPTDIQQAVLPVALAGRDIIGVAATGSGKTAAFALPILQKLWEEPKGLFAVVLTPTRELAYQIAEQFEALGSGIEVRCAVIVGGMDMVAQAIALSKRPHVVVATPGRLQDHLENTKGFNLRYLKFLVMDEADRLLDMNFGPAMDKIFKVLPKDRRTYLFSATMTTRVEKLQRASLSNPARVEVNHKYSTVSTLLQHYIFIPLTHKDAYLVHLVNEIAQNSMIIFTRTVQDSQRLALVLRKLGFPAIPIHGKLSQESRLGALNKFKSGGRSILVATDVASRGLDIPAVDVVINFDIPTYSKDYIHRVGRTARAGRSGKAITLVTQYDVELFQRIEGVIEKKMVEFVVDKEQVMLLKERVAEANRATVIEMKEDREAGGGLYGTKRKREDGEGAGAGKSRDYMDRDDDEYEAGVSRRPRGRGGRGMVRGGRGGRGGGRGRGRGRR